MEIKTSIKHLQINKANTRILIIIAVTSIVTAFSLMSTKALFQQSMYQRKVLGERNKAVKLLEANVESAKKLKAQYDVFEEGDPNIIGGQGGENAGAGLSDGDNAQIALDALPSQYDFPALISSIEKIVNEKHLTIQGISGIDAGDQSGEVSSAQPQSQSMAFSLNTQSDYQAVLTLLKEFERSIRPFDITAFSITGSASSITSNIQGNTYFQPSVSLKPEEKVIR